jgi:hypothetical protein
MGSQLLGDSGGPCGGPPPVKSLKNSFFKFGLLNEKCTRNGETDGNGKQERGGDRKCVGPEQRRVPPTSRIITVLEPKLIKKHLCKCNYGPVAKCSLLASASAAFRIPHKVIFYTILLN